MPIVPPRRTLPADGGSASGTLARRQLRTARPCRRGTAPGVAQRRVLRGRAQPTARPIRARRSACRTWTFGSPLTNRLSASSAVQHEPCQDGERLRPLRRVRPCRDRARAALVIPACVAWLRRPYTSWNSLPAGSAASHLSLIVLGRAAAAGACGIARARARRIRGSSRLSLRFRQRPCSGRRSASRSGATAARRSV
jgi:hypothetical protein